MPQIAELYGLIRAHKQAATSCSFRQWLRSHSPHRKFHSLLYHHRQHYTLPGKLVFLSLCDRGLIVVHRDPTQIHLLWAISWIN